MAKKKMLKSKKGLKRALQTAVVALSTLKIMTVAFFDGRALFNAEAYGPKVAEEQTAVFGADNTVDAGIDY